MPPRDPVCPRCGGERPFRKKYCDPCKNQADRERSKRYRDSPKGKETFKRNLITGRYGLTLEQYHAMVEAQQGKCPICGIKAELHIDHDHRCCPGIESCGKCVRGLLCGKCNRGLGMFDDDVNRLDTAVTYLLGRL